MRIKGYCAAGGGYRERRMDTRVMLRAVGAAETDPRLLGRRAETFSTLRRRTRAAAAAAGGRDVRNRAKSRGRESSIAVPRDEEKRSRRLIPASVPLRAARRGKKSLDFLRRNAPSLPSLSLSLSLSLACSLSPAAEDLQMRALRVRQRLHFVKMFALTKRRLKQTCIYLAASWKRENKRE